MRPGGSACGSSSSASRLLRFLLLLPLAGVLLYSGSVLNRRWPRPLWAYLVVGASSPWPVLALYVAPAKTRATASKGWSLLTLADLGPNWPLALDRRALPAINLGVFNSCQSNPGGECCAVEAKGKTRPRCLLRAKACREWSLLALPGLEPNWLLALDRRSLAAINLGVFDSCKTLCVGHVGLHFQIHRRVAPGLRDLGGSCHLLDLRPRSVQRTAATRDKLRDTLPLLSIA